MSKPERLEDGYIYLGDYILERLEQLDVKKIFGVPGDFNLTFLDLVEQRDAWIGGANELNSAYAADGYARVKQAQANYTGPNENRKSQGGVKGLGCLITTFGVGELSAMNGIAGAYSERVPILHIVGVPSTSAQEGGFLLHHTLGDGQFNVFERASEGITKARAILNGVKGACEEIDRVLRVALQEARPTYLTLPTDLVFAPVLKSRLDTAIVPPTPTVHEKKKLPAGIQVEDDEVSKLNFVVDEIVRLWNNSRNPVIIIDACAIRHGVTHLARDLIDATGVKYYSTPMGKGGLDEDAAKGFGGVYIGAGSDSEVKKAVESGDLVIIIGAIASDFNTAEFSWSFKTESLIELHSDHTDVQYATYSKTSFHTLLPALTAALAPKSSRKSPGHAGLQHTVPDGDKGAMVTQEAFWPLMGTFLQDDDIVLSETGTSSFGVLDMPFKSNTTLLSQVLWGSIGWTGGATLGALVAAQEAEYPRRTILFIGDGSLQLTVQEIGTMIRLGLKPIIVVLNNDGYVIERLIHGETAKYNDISTWRWQELLSFFGAKPESSKSYLANTRGELETILSDEQVRKADKIQLIEVKMDRLDAPRALKLQAEMSAKFNAS